MVSDCGSVHLLQKLLGDGESLDFFVVVKSLCETHSDVNKKYVVKICDAILQLFATKKRYLQHADV